MKTNTTEQSAQNAKAANSPAQANPQYSPGKVCAWCYPLEAFPNHAAPNGICPTHKAQLLAELRKGK